MANLLVNKLDPNSKYLNQVISLGDKNKDTLGFFPNKAYKEAARAGNILVAVLEDKCVGYILYRKVKTMSKISITHMCVDSDYRSQGIARALISKLIDLTKEYAGIGLYCRRDYQSAGFWEHLGFKYFSEKDGRGKDKKPLTYYWYDYGNPSLQSFVDEIKMQSSQSKAIIDMNIFINMIDNPSHALNSNWISEYLTFMVTPEIRSEIHRDEDQSRRKQRLSQLSNFIEIPVLNEDFEKIYKILRPNYPVSISKQDESDLKQISYALAGNAEFFVTKDNAVRKKFKEKLLSEFSLTVVSDEELIVNFDERINSASYQGGRLAGASLNINKIKSEQIDNIVLLFHSSNEETAGKFRNKLSSFLSFPKDNEVYVISLDNNSPVALMVLKNSKINILEVPLIKVNKNRFSPDIESAILFWLVNKALELNKRVIRIQKANLSKGMTKALLENSFVEQESFWEKVNITGVLTIDEVKDAIESINILNEGDMLESRTSSLIPPIALHGEQDDEKKVINIEKELWPLKIKSALVKSYVIPIQSKWAIHLFDTELGSQTFFGSNPDLVLKMENVYYRSSYTKLPKANSRILWYVSKGQSSGYQGIKSIRACSYVDEVIVGTPKDLFKKYNKLGVLNWWNLLEVADNDIEKEILLFKFSRTELFKNPIPLEKYCEISGNNSAPQAPILVGSSVFEELYLLGMGK